MKFKVLVLRCPKCKHSHAILPEDVVPYKILSKTASKELLNQHYNRKQSIWKLIFENEDILSARTVFRLIKYYKNNIKKILSAILQAESEFTYSNLEKEAISKLNKGFEEKFFQQGKLVLFMEKLPKYVKKWRDKLYEQGYVFKINLNPT